METKTEKYMETKDKNIMPQPRVCAISGVTMTRYSEVAWLPVFDKKTNEWRNAPTHVSKAAIWEASKTSPTHPNNLVSSQ